MNTLLGLLFPLGIVVLVVLSIVWHFGRSSSILEQWANQHGYRILSREYCCIKGPFIWTSGKDQVVYYVTIEDESGQKRQGWVRCGGLFLGMLSENVDVRWDR